MPSEGTPKKWKIISSVYLYKEPWLTVRRDHVALPDGHEIPSYFVLEYPDWVNTIAITKDKQFVLVRQYRHALGETHYELCAGVREAADLTPMDAAQRELLEETGYGNGSWRQHMILSPNSSTQNNLTYCFIAEGVEKVAEPKPEASEDLEVHLVPAEKLLELLESGDIIQALMVAPLWKFIMENRR